jgi:excisionase family DNA binding protein
VYTLTSDFVMGEGDLNSDSRAFVSFDLRYPRATTDAMVPTDPATADRGREDDLVFPPEDLEQLLDLARFVENHTEPGLLLGPDGEQVPLPAEVYRVLRQVIEVMRQGKATLVAPQGLLLTTQEAADFLGVSRPTLVKLLEDGAIPFEKPNRHRRVRLQDLLDFQARRRDEQRAALNQLTEEASALGLYEGSPADYATALKSARRRRARPASE